MKKRLLTLLDEVAPLHWEESRRRQACVKGMIPREIFVSWMNPSRERLDCLRHYVIRSEDSHHHHRSLPASASTAARIILAFSEAWIPQPLLLMEFIA